jgi:glycosyltransferase 2 family protein
MQKTYKIIIGIILSILLFYLFIKDVNKVVIEKDSGFRAGSSAAADRILYVHDASGFEIGDHIQIVSKTTGQTEQAVVANNVLSSEHSSCSLQVESGLKYSYPAATSFVKFPRLQRALKDANYFWLLPAFLFTLIALLIRAYRWKFFFHDYNHLHFSSLWISVCIGYMANNILPFRMGEFVRAWIFSRKEKRRISESFGTIVTERIFDILSILIVFVLFTFYFATRKDIVVPALWMKGAWIFGAISVVSLVFLIFLRFKTKSTLKLIEVVTRPLPLKLSNAIQRIATSFVQGLGIFSDFKAASIAFFISMIIWLDLAVAYYFIFLAVNIEASLMISMFLIVGLAFAVSIPSAPGFIGTFHYVGQQVLIIMGLKGNIEAYVLLAHAMAYIPIVIIGLIYLSMENLTFKELRESIQAKASEEEMTVHGSS